MKSLHIAAAAALMSVTGLVPAAEARQDRAVEDCAIAARDRWEVRRFNDLRADRIRRGEFKVEGEMLLPDRRRLLFDCVWVSGRVADLNAYARPGGERRGRDPYPPQDGHGDGYWGDGYGQRGDDRRRDQRPRRDNPDRPYAVGGQTVCYPREQVCLWNSGKVNEPATRQQFGDPGR